MTLVERHSHRVHYPSMPYKYTPVSARLGPSLPPFAHASHLRLPLPYYISLPLPLTSFTPTFPLE